MTEDLIRIHTLTDASQPTPLPPGPPRDLQALALADRAVISWREPGPRGGQGRAAWADWSYALLLEDDAHGELVQDRQVRGRGRLVPELHERSVYSVRVAAYTGAGEGPWSNEFKLRTLE